MTITARARSSRPEAITFHLRAAGPEVVKRTLPSCVATIVSRGLVFFVPSGAARHPFGLPVLAMRDGIEHQFHARRNPQLVEDAEQIFFDRVLAQSEFVGLLPIAAPVSDECDDLFFPWREQRLTAGIHDAQSVYVGQGFQNVM